MPNRRYGYRALADVSGYNSGTVHCPVWWYDQDGNYITVTNVPGGDAAGNTALSVFAEVTAPEYAFFAVPGGCVVADSHLVAKWTAIQFGPHVMESPADIPLSTIPGEAAAPIELWGDVAVESDAHAVHVGCGPNDRRTWIVEAENLAGFGTLSVDALAYPTGGANNSIHVHNVLDSGDIDTRDITLGTYELWARVHTNAGHTGTYGVSFDGGTTLAETCSTTLTTYSWYSLGQVKVPAKRSKPGVAANITVTAVAEAAAGEAYVDRYAFVPVSFGGWASYLGTVVTEHVSDFDVVDHVILLDGAANYAGCSGGIIVATKRDELRVVAEQVACNEVTHAIVMAPLCTPQYSLWR